MDGTLLDSSSRIRPESAEAIRAATALGVRVVLATGKARPAAIAACRDAGLEGDQLLVSLRTPGVFLQVGAAAGRCNACAHVASSQDVQTAALQVLL
jgi:magnesium-transporting ATPase (P-type)